MTEEEALDGLKKSNPDALKFIYIQNRQKCLNWAVKSLSHATDHSALKRCSPEEAADLYQEAVITLAENVQGKRLTQLNVKFATYLIAVMKNLWRSQMRKANLTLFSEVKEKEPEVLPDLEEIQQKVRQALAQIDEACRAMLTLRYFNAMPYEDIALVLNYNNGSVVRNLISRCRSKFRKLY